MSSPSAFTASESSSTVPGIARSAAGPMAGGFAEAGQSLLNAFSAESLVSLETRRSHATSEGVSIREFEEASGFAGGEHSGIEVEFLSDDINLLSISSTCCRDAILPVRLVSTSILRPPPAAIWFAISARVELITETSSTSTWRPPRSTGPAKIRY